MGARQVFLIPRDAVQQGAEPVGVHCCRCHGDRVQLEVHFNSRTTLETLTIGDFAARSGVAPSALRYYEREGLIRSTRTTGNQRRYERAELRRVAFIRIAQQVGVSLERISEALKSLPDNRTPTKADWARLSARWRHKLDERIM